MNWQFWNKKEKEPSQIERLQEELSTVNAQLKNVSEQVTKLTRVQFKSSKNIEEKLNNIGSTLAAQNELVTENNRYKKQQDQFMQNMIRLLDELDHVSSGIKGSDQVWYELLGQWSRSIEKNLKGIGVYQLDIIGKIFNPEVAESMKTVSKDTFASTPVVPYQVVEVINRGYITESGQLIRKAKVVTVREEDLNGE